MFFFELLTMLLVAIVGVVVATQIIVPAVTGEPFFPLFRKTPVQQEIKKVEKELADVAVAAHLQDLTTEINRRKAQLEQK